MLRQQPSHRPKSQGYSSNTKRAAVGSTAGMVPPAWRSNVAQQRPGYYDGHTQIGAGPDRRPFRRGPVSTAGSKIFMSQLPADESVKERDIEELFRETIGPVFDVSLLYNSQGRSKGMAVVHFQRIGDAVEARRMYNGKIIDGRRPLKIELITDPPEATSPPPPPKEKSLVERLGGSVNGTSKSNAHSITNGSSQAANIRAQPQQRHGIQRRNMKKGPRRLKKSLEQLDREMEAYRAEALHFSETNVKAAVGVGFYGNAMQE